MVAPAGRMRLSADGIVRDSGPPDRVFPSAVEDLPADTLVYLLGSRYCETDRLSEIAWQLFQNTAPGWGRVQAICDSSTITSLSDTSTHAPAKRRGRLMRKARASAATMPILPSRSAAA